MRSARRSIPSFLLYGEQGGLRALTESVHVEDIPSRSSKYLGQINAHRHQNLSQCVLITEGPAEITLEDSQHSCQGPALVLVPAGTIHGFRFRPETKGFVLTVDCPRLLADSHAHQQASITALLALPRVCHLVPRSAFASRLTALLNCLLQECHRPERLPQAVAALLACSVLITVADGSNGLDFATTQSGDDIKKIRAFRALIELHFADHWSVARYARSLKQSETALNRLCRRVTGSTAFCLIQERLTLEARRRLVHDGASVSGIAHDLGFTDLAYFSRFFRRHSGISPNAFRRGGAGVKIPGRARIVQ